MPVAHRAALILVLISLALTGAIYGSSLNGPFLFDDQQNIVENAYVQPKQLTWQSLSTAAAAFGGFPGRPVSTLSFALSYYLNGLDPAAFKAVNLVIHLLCGWILFGLCRLSMRVAAELKLTRLDERHQLFAAALAASLWLLHPLHVSTVLYAVQRMAMLATLFCLLGLLAYVEMRRQQLQGQWGALPFAGLLMSLLLAVLSKENGALLPLLCGVFELCLFRLQASSPVTRRMLQITWLGGLVAGIGAVCWLLPQFAQWLQESYAGREFTLTERLLTQPRVMLLYLKLLLLPNVRAMTLYHDDLPISVGWLSPVSTIPALMLLLGLISTTAFLMVRRHRLLGLGFGLFFVGHLLESTVIPLEMVFEHRNYLPSAGLFFSLSLLWTTALPNARWQAWPIGLLALLALLCAQRAQIYSRPFELVKFTLLHHPQSLRTQLWAGDTYRSMATVAPPARRSELIGLAIPHYRKAADLDPFDAIGLFQILELQAIDARPLDASVFTELARRLNQGPVRAGTIIAANSFLDSIAKGSNPFPADEALALAGQLLANPRCGGRGRAIVLSAVATVQTEVFQDFETAIANSQAATQLQPQDPSLWIPLAVILSKAGRNDAAEQAVLSALAVDRGAFQQTLHAILATIRAQPPIGPPPN